MTFDHLLAPGRIGSMELRNRILMCPMGDSIAEPDGSVSDRQVAYYGARARGGTALIIVGSVGVAYPAGSYGRNQTAASQDAHIPGLQRLAEEVHRHGGKIAAQLVHDAANSRYDMEQGLPLLVSAMAQRSAPDTLSTMVTAAEGAAMMAPFMAPTARYELHAATEGDIAEAVEWFAAAAARCIAAGFDGIELHAGHGYLIDWFLSPAKNTRTDAWGGDLAGRARFLCEVIRAVRERTADAVPVWLRLNAAEPHTPGGTTIEDAVAVVGLAEAAGAAAVHVSAYGNPMVALGVTDSHTPHSPGGIVHLAAAIKPTTRLPVITFGRLEPEHAEAVLADGTADFISMGRKLLADPDLPNKLAAGRLSDVRPCIYQYRCIGNIFLLDGIACVSNAATAHGDEAAPPLAANPRHVLIAGGGPAGMEAARLLAAGGHRITLVEAGPELGGHLLIAGACDPTLEQMRRYLIAQVAQADIELIVGTPVTSTFVAELAPDLVIDATGIAWPGLDPLAEWIRGDADAAGPGARVLLLGGDKPAVSLASHLTTAGRSVTIAEPSGVLCQAFGLPGRFRLVHDIQAAGVITVTEPPADAEFDTTIDTRRGSASPLAVDGYEVIRLGDVSGTAGLEAAFAAARALAFTLAE